MVEGRSCLTGVASITAIPFPWYTDHGFAVSVASQRPWRDSPATPEDEPETNVRGARTDASVHCVVSDG